MNRSTNILPNIRATRINNKRTRFMTRSPGVGRYNVNFSQFGPPNRRTSRANAPSKLRSSELRRLFRDVLRTSIIISTTTHKILYNLDPLTLHNNRVLFTFTTLRYTYQTRHVTGNRDRNINNVNKDQRFNRIRGAYRRALRLGLLHLPIANSDRLNFNEHVRHRKGVTLHNNRRNRTNDLYNARCNITIKLNRRALSECHIQHRSIRFLKRAIMSNR